jgi:hypothetical protein
MSARLADRLNAARQRRFVGRASELALFGSALAAPELPFALLFVFGPGGVGKTALLGEFAAHCTQLRTPIYTIDARRVESTPEAFLDALRRSMALAPSESPVALLGAYPRRQVVLIDTYEMLAPLDRWLREVFLPQLSAQTLVVLAGREPPALAWRSDPGWQTLLQLLPLRNLAPAESRTYLNLCAVPADQQQAVLDFTHGHPLALSLVADVFAQRPDIQFQPAAVPDTIKTLLEQLVQKVPGPAHRGALEACAVVRLTTEALLAELLQLPDVHDLFDWLRSLSFIESGPQGLFPHDLAREALDADLRWRNPDWYTELQRRAGGAYLQRFERAHGQDLQEILFDALFLYRHNPVMRPFYSWDALSQALPSPARGEDWPALRAMVAQHEGEESARLAEYWFARQPQGVTVFRAASAAGSTSTPDGFLAAVALHQTSADDRAIDPAVQATWQYLAQTAPLREGEGATLFRFFMARDTYQAISPIQSLASIVMLRHFLTTPQLALIFFPCADPDFWAPFCAYIQFPRIETADFTVGGRRYGVYGQDLRVVPPMTWLLWMGERGILAGSAAVPPPPAVTPLLVLSQEEFAAAARAALHDFARPDALLRNPLLRSRLIGERTGGAATDAERASRLRTLLKAACETLQASPRETKLHRTLYHTYLQPAPTQEQAAELLDLPFGTYRRYLKAGVTRVIELLWQWELQGNPEQIEAQRR